MSDNKKERDNEFKKYILHCISTPIERNKFGDILTSPELEIKFGTNWDNPITRTTFENCIKKIKSLGWVINNEQLYLNIQNQFYDKKSGRNKMSNIRTTIDGLSKIQAYCKKNMLNLEDITGDTGYYKFLRKDRIKDNSHIEPAFLNGIFYKDFQFKINYKNENSLNSNHTLVKIMLNQWQDTKKTFRLIKRYTFKNDKFPFLLSFSIIKTSKSKRDKNNYLPTHTIQESNVFQNAENYEIELEYDDDLMRKIHPDMPTNYALKVENVENQWCKLIHKYFKTNIKAVLSGIQNSNFPISYDEQDDVLKKYIDLIIPDKDIKKKELLEGKLFKRKNRKNFIGPSSISLEMKNIIKDSGYDTIYTPYAVTDKADGERRLMYIPDNGKIYLIDINMNITFTGSIIKTTEHKNCIFDGEYVGHDKHGKYINNYLIFDIYFIDKEDVRKFPLIFKEGFKYEKKMENKGRLEIIAKYMKDFKPVSIIKNKTNSMIFKTKQFHANIQKNDDGSDKTIFQCCQKIYEKIDNGGFEYETDGLIFTPIDKSVGAYSLGEPDSNKTWTLSFKWKPPEFNTVDFLITTVKDDNKNDIVNNIYETGTSLTKKNHIKQYKTLELRVGFDPEKHGYKNPLDIVLNDNIKYDRNYRWNKYKPVKFIPTEPALPYEAHLMNVMIKRVGNNNFIYTENGKEVINDETIIECKWVHDNEKYWQWIPIRVRHDKTADYKKTGRNFGNAYHVAHSVWKSIHNPITKHMIITGKGISDIVNDDDIYYNSKNKIYSNTTALRHFHNRYVKFKLIKSVCQKKGTLVDLAVGKGGDLHKWISSDLGFVMGFDLFRDNIENSIDGACARYITEKRQRKSTTSCLFLQGDSRKLIRNGDCCKNIKSKYVINALFGYGSNDADKIGKLAADNYGLVKNGFDVVSTQFALHFFFQDNKILHTYLRNVCEMCKVGGYFIGTCYNGNKIFKLLKRKKYNESHIFKKKDKKICEIKKLYDNDTFPNNYNSVGLKINVYQESINDAGNEEYLVNFDYLKLVLEKYGFKLLKKDELRDFGMKKSVDSFEQMYSNMKDELDMGVIKKNFIGDALNMSAAEKKLSFLNNYFIFKKIRNVNAKTLNENIFEKMKDKIHDDDDIISHSSSKPKKKYRKLKIRMTLPSQ